MQPKKITIVGAGLIGSLLAVYLRKQGHSVTMFEGRPDLRKEKISAGKSINLALSDRGWRPLKEVGLEDDLLKMIIPMKSRLMHDMEGNLTYQPYGKEGQAINSISRGGLNALLMNTAEELGVDIQFNHKCIDVDFEHNLVEFNSKGKQFQIHSDLIFGTDGAFSAVRAAMQRTDRFTFSQSYIPHGYKELVIPATNTGGFAIEKNVLHIWPRGAYMLIALPNLDGSFTVTLFLPFEGKGYSFENLNTDDKVKAFFKEIFPDALEHMPTLLKDFNAHPASSLVTVKSYPWIRKNTMILGDAAHAVVPFYGQGMNCGFEDCYELNKLIEKNGDNWEKTFEEFNTSRPENTDAIADLAVENFVEMRDKVGDEMFLLRKKIEAHINDLYPDKWIPQYSMVTFNPDLGYAEAAKIGKIQRQIMDEVMAISNIKETWQNLDFKMIIEDLQESLAS